MNRNQGQVSRRQLLETLPATLATLGLAGCQDTTIPGRDPDYKEPDQPDSGTDTTSDGSINKQPETPAAHFKHTAHDNTEYTFNDLPQFTTVTPPRPLVTNANKRGTNVYQHPDTDTTSITVTETTATATINQLKLTRDLQLTFLVRTAVSKDTYQTTSHTLNPKEDGGDTEFTDYTIEFDISNVPQPMNASGFVELAATDTAAAETTRSLKRHQYVVFDTEDNTKWVNNDGRFNLRYYQDEARVPYVAYPAKPNQGYFEYEDLGIQNDYDSNDTPPDRRIYMATRVNHSGELIAGTAKISGETYQQFHDSTFYHTHDFRYESRFADQISHLNELGKYIWESLEYAGITSDYAQLESLGDLIQHLKYGTAHGFEIDTPPTVTLYNLTGDCTEKTALYTSICRSKAWGGRYRTASLKGTIKGTDHIVVGIDERDFTPPDDANIYYVNAGSQDLPDTRYAFFELTSDSEIGDFSEDVYEVEGVYDTSAYDNMKDSYTQKPPDY